MLEEKDIIVSQFILFGSHAKGNSDLDSDIDVYVVSESFRNKSFFKRIDMVGDAVAQTIYKFDTPIDALLKTPEEIDSNYIEHIGAVIFAA